MTFFFLHNAIQPSNISFTHRPVLELCLQVLVHFFRLGYKIRPEVAMSSRCTIIGPVASGYTRRTRP